MDNFETVYKLIENDEQYLSKENFYVVSIIQRSKDYAENKNHFIRHYFVRNKAELLTLKPSIIDICQKYHARAYFGLDVKNIRKVIHAQITHNLELLTKREFDGSEILSYRNSFDSICNREECSESKLRYIMIDIDDLQYIEIVRTAIEKYPFTEIPSKNGVHFIGKIRNEICNINLKDLGDSITKIKTEYNIMNEIEIKKNSMTVLYCDD